jgi:hypothetical protein
MTEGKRELLSHPKGENLPAEIENRVLILGSRISGAFRLGGAFQKYLEQKGIPEPSVEVLRDAGLIELAVLGRTTIEEGRENPCPPEGVILLPEMRQYSSSSMGMSLETYECGISDHVEALCQKYGIPLVQIKEYRSSEQIEQGLRKLLSPGDK